MPKRKFPRSVRGAIRRGWHSVTVNHEQRVERNISHMGLHIWCQFNLKGKFQASFQAGKNLSTFAFEKPEDAGWFTLKFQ